MSQQTMAYSSGGSNAMTCSSGGSDAIVDHALFNTLVGQIPC